MRHLLTAAVVVTLHVALVACAVNPQPSTGPAPVNETAAHVAEALTDQIFGATAPAVNAQVAKLPEDAQALAQAAYMALEASIRAAESKGIAQVSGEHAADALKALQGLTQAIDVLHTTLHEADARAPTVIEEPNRGH